MTLTGIFIGLALVVQVQAVQQTPESAQRFLARVLPQEASVAFPGLPIPARMLRTSEISSAEEHCRTVYDVMYPDTGASTSGGIWWQSVLQVQQSGNAVVVTHAQGGQTTSFVFGAEALATRAAYAMEFLRQHCDPSADTGF